MALRNWWICSCVELEGHLILPLSTKGMVTHFPSLIRFSRVMSVHTQGAVREWLFSGIYLPELGAIGTTILPEGGKRNAFKCRAKGRDGINGQEKGKTVRFSPNTINDESGHHNRPENYALFAFMAFSTSMLLFSPLE